MRVLRGRADDPAADRAATGALVERTRESGTPGLRVWRPPRQLAFGRRDARAPGYERARELAAEAGFPPLERSTGGRAVAYTGTTVAVALARPDDDLRAGIDERYAATTGPLQRALWRLGAPVQRGEPPEAFCPGEHSLSFRGKVAGVAQRVRKGVSLVGAVVVVDDHGTIADVLGPVYDALGVPFDSDAVGSIDRAGGRTDPAAVVETIETVFVGDSPVTVDRVEDLPPAPDREV